MGSLEKKAQDVVLDSINDGVFTVDKERKISSFNRAAERITGVSKTRRSATIVGRSFGEVIVQTTAR